MSVCNPALELRGKHTAVAVNKVDRLSPVSFRVKDHRITPTSRPRTFGCKQATLSPISVNVWIHESSKAHKWRSQHATKN